MLFFNITMIGGMPCDLKRVCTARPPGNLTSPGHKGHQARVLSRRGPTIAGDYQPTTRGVPACR